MHKVIITKYLPATSCNPPRMVVSTEDNSRMYTTWDDNISNDGNHLRAARVFMFKMNWVGDLVMGYLGRGKGVVHVFVPDGYHLSQNVRPLGELLKD